MSDSLQTAADTHYKFTIDNHNLTVIAADFVPINPYTTDIVNIAIGQRYDIIVEANAVADNYWLRAIPQTSCSDSADPANSKGIVRYDGATSTTADPVSTANANAAIDECVDEDAANLVPYLSLDAASLPDVNTNFAVALSNVAGRVYWAMGNSTFINQWSYPTIQQIVDSGANDSAVFAAEQSVYELPDANVWVYWIIQTALGAAHPMHLHGHDFWVLGSGSGKFDAATAELKTVGVPRRDVVLLPASGWVAFAFLTDNPGVSWP